MLFLINDLGNTVQVQEFLLITVLRWIAASTHVVIYA